MVRHLISVPLGLFQELSICQEVLCLTDAAQRRLTFLYEVLISLKLKDVSREVVVDKLNHPLALCLHELVGIVRVLDIVLGHQLVLRLVRAQSYLTAAQDLAIEIVHALQLVQYFVLLKQCLSLSRVEAETAAHTLDRRLTLLQQGVGILAKCVIPSKHLALVHQHDILEILLKLCMQVLAIL